MLDANEALGVAGNATYAAARSLVEIKKDVKNKNWKALTDSGVLRMSGRSARDLASAYETWLSSTDIPQDVLSQMSVRTLAKIGNAPANQRTKAVNMLKDGRILSEGDLNKMLRKNTPKKSMDDLLKDAELVASKKTDSEKAQGFTALIMENIKLKKQVADLKEELSKAKALAR